MVFAVAIVAVVVLIVASSGSDSGSSTAAVQINSAVGVIRVGGIGVDVIAGAVVLALEAKQQQ